MILALLACSGPPDPLPTATAEEREKLDRYWTDCEAGEARGCAALGALFLDGRGVERDPTRAVALYERGCAGGRGCATLGWLLQEGVGAPRDLGRAAVLYARACEAGEAAGCGNLGVAVSRGRGVPLDASRGRALFGRACEGGHTDSCVNLGFALQHGEGGPVDLAAARAAYLRACEAGNPTGCNNLGLLRPQVERATVLSPAEGSRVRVDRVPLGIALPEGHGEDDPVDLFVDGAPYVDRLALSRRGISAAGWGVLHLATLDLSLLAPGEHLLEARAHAAGGATSRVVSRFSTDPPPNAVHLRVRDGEGRPVSARVALFDRDGPVLLGGPDAAGLDPQGRDSRWSAAFAVRGEVVVRLDSGWHRFVATRGPRWSVAVAERDVAGDTEVDLRIDEVVPTPGQVAADLHVHTGRSADAFVPDRLRYESIAVSGLDVVAVTDHDRVVDPTAALAPFAGPLGIAGVEADFLGDGGNSRGHFNAMPARGAWAPSAAATPGALVAELRRLGGGPMLVQVNHPRGIQFDPDNLVRADAHALFGALGFRRDERPGSGANTWMADFEVDAIEVANRFSWTGWKEVRADWFALLGWGARLTGTGNSDSHGLAVELAGLPMNLVEAPLDEAAVVEAIRAGRVSVSTGPVAELAVRGPGGTAGPGGMVAGPEVVAEVRVRAPPWVPVDEVRVVVDGAVVHSLSLPPSDAVERAAFALPLRLDADAWVLVEAGWPLSADAPAPQEAPEPWAWVAPAYVPLAFTNPVRIDADGDGAWVPPGFREPSPSRTPR